LLTRRSGWQEYSSLASRPVDCLLSRRLFLRGSIEDRDRVPPDGGIVKIRIAVAVLMAVLFAGTAAKISAEAAYRVYVLHKGAWICVDDDSLDGHLKHGDYTEYQSCSVQ
jgi:hypothetical protein